MDAQQKKKKSGHFECSPNYSVLKSGWKIHMTDFCTSQLCIVLGVKPVIIDTQMHFAQFRNEPKAIFCLCFSHKGLYIMGTISIFLYNVSIKFLATLNTVILCLFQSK